jgi:2-amino-4-hydroxy-6-hydroxymethyldihydropteridine diphosphokinase
MGPQGPAPRAARDHGAGRLRLSVPPAPPNAVRCALGLGGNVGPVRAAIESACVELRALRGTRLVARSGVIVTAPVGPVPQPHFLNAAAVVETALAPRDLLAGVLEIERRHGRERSREERWGPRTLDIDILLYGDLQVVEPGLRVPHPALAARRFALAPLAEIAPDWPVPGTGLTVAALLRRLDAGPGAGG